MRNEDSSAGAAGGTMRAAVLTGPGRLAVGEAARPEPGAGQVRDPAGGVRRVRLQPHPLGRAGLDAVPDRAGRARARGLGRGGRGRATASRGCRPGDRVAALSYKAYAEYDLADADAVVPLPAALAGQPFPGEPLGCAMNIFRRSGIEAGQTVAIVGIGFLGAILTRLATDAGARVIAVSRRPFSLDVARASARPRRSRWRTTTGSSAQVKELTGGVFCDRVIEAVGKQWPLDLAARADPGARPADRRRLPPGRPAAGQYVALELARPRRDQRPRARPEGLRPGHPRGRGGRRLRPARPEPALHPQPSRSTGLDEALDATRDRPDGFLKALVTALMSAAPTGAAPAAAAARPRLGFLGVGWIGRHRMQAILEAGAAEAAAIADPSPETAAEAGRLAPEARLVSTLDDLLDCGRRRGRDRHAERPPCRAVDPGAGARRRRCSARSRSAARRRRRARWWTRRARRTGCSRVDLSYRFTEGMRRIREVVRSGELGRVYAVDLVFHNAYGPDKPWFYDPALVGRRLRDGSRRPPRRPRPVGARLPGGFGRVEPPVRGRRAARRDAPRAVEDYAVATLDLDTGAAVRLACSWRLQAGCDADHLRRLLRDGGRRGAAQPERLVLRFRRRSATGAPRARRWRRPPDAWGGRAAVGLGERASPRASASTAGRSGSSRWPGCSTGSTAAEAGLSAPGTAVRRRR